MRKLASVQTVNAVEPIPNADAIERVRVLGWWVVCKKGEHKPGDKLVYCEIDSFLPERPAFEFLRASSFKPPLTDLGVVVRPAGFRIKTVRLRGQVSQGICFPLAILPADTPTDEGTDVTDALGVLKYEPPPPVNMKGRVRGDFPGFLSKTDETRVQVLEPVLARCRGETFVVTEKLDGTSFTAFLRDGAFGVCSRNQWLDETDDSHLLVKFATRLSVEAKLRALKERFGFSPAVQGEVIGPGVQGNKYGVSAHRLFVFNLIDLDASRLLDVSEQAAALTAVGFDPVPPLGEVVLAHTVDELVALAAGMSVLNAKTHREGIVLRPAVERFDPDVGGRLSFKAINPQFLLKYDE